MNTMLWFEKHLSEERMIGLLDGELSGRATQTAERHLKSCWTCRHKCEQLRLAMNQFVEIREALLAAPSAQPPGGWSDFDGRLLRAEVAPLAYKFASEPMRVGRPLLAPAAIAVTAGLLVWLLHVAPLSAKEVLARSSAYEASALARAGKAVIVQDLKIESRHRVAKVSIWRAPSIKRSKSFWAEGGDPGLKNELESIYRRAGLEWTEPLSASNHSRWEASLVHHSESVQSDNGTLHVITHNDDRPQPGEIAVAELVVRAADWSPIEERFKVNDPNVEEYRVIETSYRVESSSAELSRMYDILSPQETQEAKTLVKPAATVAPIAAEAETPAADLADSEVEALSLLHLIKADRLEAATVTRTKSQIVVEAYIADEERRGLIERLLSPVKSVNLVLHPLAQSEDRTAAVHGAEPAAVVVPQGPMPAHDPVLLRPLVEQVGSMEVASDLVAQRLESLADLGVQLRALERLSARFPAETRDGLSVEARHRLDQLALDYLDAARRAWREWEMSAGSFQAVLSGDSSAPDSALPQSFCGAWEDERSLADVASRLQDLFSQGFTSTSGQSQIDSDLSGASIGGGIRQLSAVLMRALSPECLH
jgi:hypothetical protein